MSAGDGAGATGRVCQLLAGIGQGDPRSVARGITLVENNAPEADALLAGLDGQVIDQALILGITGPPGAGKSTLTNCLISHYLDRPDGGSVADAREGAGATGRGERLGVIAIDPSSPISGGALLGDRIRMMDHALNPKVIVRSMATRGRLGGLCSAAGGVARIMAASGCRLVIIETVGVGQAEMDIVRLADLTLLVLAPGLGDEIQAMKSGLLEVADILVVNKVDNPGAEALALDLETAVRTRRQGGVVMTSAAQGQGIEILSDKIDEIAAQHQTSGERARRRREAFHSEVVDWALELIRPRVMAAVVAEHGLESGDPRRRASEILGKIGFDQG